MKPHLSWMRSRFRVVVQFVIVTCLFYSLPGCFGGLRSDEPHTSHKEVAKPVVDVPSSKKVDGNVPTKSEIPPIECQEKDKECERDKLGLEAIKSLHILIDDDHNGNVDQSESDEFIRDELQYTDGFERHSLFHNNDKLISVDDLWKAWKHSTVYNWTVDDVIEWLVQDVDLPQYTQVFHNLAIDGSVLPRLVNSTGPLLVSLGVRNPVHKQKLSLKAMDTVLFGAPKKLHSYVKDIMLFMAILFAIGISWFACLHHRYSQTQVKKMMKDLESLQKAEDALKKLSKELADAEKNQISMPPEKQEELRMLRQSSIRLKVSSINNSGGDKSPSSLSRDNSVYRKREGERKLKQAEEELATLREALSEAENKLEIQQLETQWSVPGELQAWLQLTHELEQIHYNAKRQAAERQLLAARDGCDKIKRRNKAFFGSLRMAHSNSLDDIDQSILDARGALEEVKQDLQERLHRWHTIELLCGFAVISNPGLSSLKQALGRDTGAPPTRLPGSLLAPMSIEEGDEDLPPTDEGKDSNNIYNQIPERQRQQIVAWARRSRINYRNKKTTINGYSSGSGPSSGRPSTFHKQQVTSGSTGSLAHLGKAPSSGSAGGGHVRSGSRDELQGFGLASTGSTGTGGSSSSSVVFHLGENPQYDRTFSSTSQSPISPNPTNSHHQQGQIPGHHTQPRSNYNQSMTYPPFAYNMASTPALSPGLNKTGSSGNLLASSTIPRGGGSSMKLYGPVSGGHPAAKAYPQSNTSASIPSQNITESMGAKFLVNNSGDVINNNNIISSNLSGISDSLSAHAGIPHSTSMIISQHQQSLNQSSQLDDSDDASLDSIPRSHSHPVLPKAQLLRAPEVDISSMDSLNSSRSGGLDKSSEKRSKKKKFLPNFFHKNKGKQKTS